VALIGEISPRPLLLISTGDDFERSVARGYYGAAGDPKELLEIPEAGHGGGLDARPEVYRERVGALFERALLAVE
jgi:hypothetical protein